MNLVDGRIRQHSFDVDKRIEKNMANPILVTGAAGRVGATA